MIVMAVQIGGIVSQIGRDSTINQCYNSGHISASIQSSSPMLLDVTDVLGGVVGENSSGNDVMNSNSKYTPTIDYDEGFTYSNLQQRPKSIGKIVGCGKTTTFGSISESEALENCGYHAP